MSTLRTIRLSTHEHDLLVFTLARAIAQRPFNETTARLQGLLQIIAHEFTEANVGPNHQRVTRRALAHRSPR